MVIPAPGTLFREPDQGFKLTLAPGLPFGHGTLLLLVQLGFTLLPVHCFHPRVICCYVYAEP